jgi:hypothetical protein
VPSPLFNFLFLAALFVPAAMYLTGVILLMISLFASHRRHVVAERRWHSTEAVAH